MIKRIQKVLMVLLFLVILNSTVYATEKTDFGKVSGIPSLTIEQLTLSMKSKQAKVDIIKKNNIELEKYKNELTNQIKVATEKINQLKIEVSENKVVITEEKVNELKSLLQFLQESSKTLEEDVKNVAEEIDRILDLILAKGMQLEQYDQIIENQNAVIVKMKSILNTVEKI